MSLSGPCISALTGEHSDSCRQQTRPTSPECRKTSGLSRSLHAGFQQCTRLALLTQTDNMHAHSGKLRTALGFACPFESCYANSTLAATTLPGWQPQGLLAYASQVRSQATQHQIRIQSASASTTINSNGSTTRSAAATSAAAYPLWPYTDRASTSASMARRTLRPAPATSALSTTLTTPHTTTSTSASRANSTLRPAAATWVPAPPTRRHYHPTSTAGNSTSTSMSSSTLRPATTT